MKSIKILFFLFHLVFLINKISCHKKPILFKCEHNIEDELNPISNTIAKTSIKEKEDQRRRIESSADEDGFVDFNIELDLLNIINDINRFGLNAHKNFFISSMQKAVEVLKSILKVKPLKIDYKFSSDDLEQLNIEVYDETKFGEDSPGLKAQGIHLVIFGMLTDLGTGTLATASARGFQVDDGQPYVGVVKINKNINYSLPHSEEYFQSILVHEFTHILGFSKNFFEKYYKNIYYKEDQYGIMRAYLNSPKVLEVARKYFNCSSLEGVELENQGGNGTEGSHWEARILLGEYMNGYSYSEEMVISEFTLAVLEDSGYYKPKYYTGGLMRYGKHKGCEFLRQKCLDPSTHKMNEKFENEFFDSVSKDSGGIDASCTSGRQSRTYNAFFQAEEEDYIPEEYRYFADPKTLAYEPADFCPVPLKYQEEEDKAYFSGHCSTKGSGYYGSILPYQSDTFDGTSQALAKITGEKLTNHSFCFLSSLAKSSESYSQFVSTVVRANCYEIFCSDKSLTIKIFDDYVVCPRAGGKVKVEGYEGYLLCPDYNLMCSGTVICNDIFECIEKKSEIKDIEYTYDYEIKTSQNIEKSKDAEFDTSNYELSENGKCSIDCSHCQEKNKCIKCRDGYLKLENNGDITCLSNDTLKNGYFLNETTNLLETCMDNCLICSNKTTCGKCKAEHIYKQKKCVKSDNPEKLIENCLEYNINDGCTKCNADSGFKQTHRDICYSLENDLKGHYTKDGGISYYPCSRDISNCTKCYYDKDLLRAVCQECSPGLILLDKNKGVCTEKEKILDNKKFYLINETHAGNCSKAIDNCMYCDNSTYCSKCNYGYTFVNITINGTEIIECVNKTFAKELEADDIGENGKDEDIDNDDLNSKYFSFANVFMLQTIYIIFLLIKF